MFYLGKAWIVKVHGLKGSHTERFVNVLIIISLTELNPLSTMKETKDVGVEGGTTMEGELAEISAWPLQEPAACCSKQYNSLHVINSSDQKPALFFFPGNGEALFLMGTPWRYQIASG